MHLQQAVCFYKAYKLKTNLMELIVSEQFCPIPTPTFWQNIIRLVIEFVQRA